MTDLYALHKLTIGPSDQPLFALLAEAIPGLSRQKARQTIMAGLVELDGKPILEAKTPVPAAVKAVVDLRHGIKRALKQRLYDGAGTTTGQPFRILHLDQDVLVVDKASGILSAPTHSRGSGEPPERGHLMELVRRALRKKGSEVNFLGVVHRLDQDTSGCLVLALTRDAHRMLLPQFRAHSAGRVYRALVIGQPRRESDELHQRQGRGEDGRRTVVEEDEPGKDAVTKFKVLRRFTHGAELEVELDTGRTHQIRVALANIGCPVYGDHVYIPRRRPTPGELPPPR